MAEHSSTGIFASSAVMKNVPVLQATVEGNHGGRALDHRSCRFVGGHEKRPSSTVLLQFFYRGTREAARTHPREPRAGTGDGVGLEHGETTI